MGKGDPNKLDLHQGWQICASPAGLVEHVDQLGPQCGWLDAPFLGPVAAILRQLGLWSLDDPPRRFDAQDWWFRLRFDLPELPDLGDACELGLDGLATLAEVWLNGHAILRSANMFVAHRLPVGPLLKPQGNELVVVCRSLDKALTQRRPRPRWRAPMIENQQLRWFRTTLLGRTPGWSPPAAVVGPWRGVWLAPAARLGLGPSSLNASLVNGVGRLTARVELQGPLVDQISQVQLRLARGAQIYRARLARVEGLWAGQIELDSPALWWPHTHGEPALYEAQLEVALQEPGETLALDLGAVGFRTVQLDRSNDGFGLSINGLPVFARGACWTPLDPVTLDAPSRQYYAQALAQVREAGMNMVRVSGTMSYESKLFYDECDRQGVMVWQEFMFANMDYPEDDSFVSAVTEEVRQQLRGWQARPAITVLCGNSEVEQQAAMFGAERARWAPALFHQTLAAEAAAFCPDVPYWPSSAHGGSFPHQGDVGTTSYYGVGAYERDLGDARRSNLRFATECLAFSNVPEAAAMACMPGGLTLRVHHPAWKARAPRDLGAGWDFEDVRDHYLARLFELDPARLRYSDHERYLSLARVTSGEVMAATFADWRREASSCRGALVWFLRDLWPGAGWGIVDSLGQPKAAYYGLKRTLQPISIALTDEGGNGVYVHVCNEAGAALRAEVEITAWRHDQSQVAQGRLCVEVPARSAKSWPLMDCFDWFADWSWAYRFGPPSAQIVSARLLGEQGQAQDPNQILAQAFAFPAGMVFPQERDLGLQAHAKRLASGEIALRLSTERFAQSVHFEVEGYVPDDAYFHLAPGEHKCVLWRPLGGSAPSFSGCVRALNSDAIVNIQLAHEVD